MPVRRSLFFCLVLGAVLLLLPAAQAQHGGGGGGMPRGGMPGGGAPGYPGGGGPGGDNGTRRPDGGSPPGDAPDAAGTVSTMRGGLQLGPPGRWWDDKHFAKSLKLRPEQQRRMDQIFEENRPSLLQHYESLQQEETRLESLTKTSAPDENQLFAQIDRVTQARAALEKANAHYLLTLRGEMDLDQIGRLEQHR